MVRYRRVLNALGKGLEPYGDSGNFYVGLIAVNSRKDLCIHLLVRK